MVRKRLRGQITEQFLTQDGSLDILQLHPQWEAEMTRAEAEAGRGGQSSVPQLQKRLAEAVQSTLSALTGGTDVVLAVPDHRRRLVRMMLTSSGIGLPVMGLDEIDPAAKVRLVGTVDT